MELYDKIYIGLKTTVNFEGHQGKTNFYLRADTCTKRKSTFSCLLAIPAFDRKAGLNSRHLNSNRGICLR